MMPAKTIPDVPRYIQPEPTKEDLEFADLAIIDLSKAATPEGKAELVNQLRDAMASVGFFYVINHGYSQVQTDRIFDIAHVPFSQVSQEEQEIYIGSEKLSGTYQGYKRRQYWHIQGGILDQVEQYNINRHVHQRPHPQVIRPLLPEIAAFARHNHFNILFPVLRLLALGLELPEDAFVKLHRFDEPSASSVRFMKYHPRTEEEEEKSANVWLKGHTDIGSISILWSQPVSGLQVLGLDDKWRWIKHINNGLVVNAGDAMEFFSGGYYRATIHRVIQPPDDQRDLARLGTFYFSHPEDSTKLMPFMQSPVLQKVGIKEGIQVDNAPTMEVWRKGRTASYGVVPLSKSAVESRVEEEVIEGVVVKHYN